MEFETWFTRVVFGVGFVLMIILMKRELTKRKIKQTENTSNIYTVWLNRFTVLTMAICASSLLFGIINKIPIICEYTYALPSMCWGLAPATITMYQIVRLQYVFSANQVHSKKYGYSKYIFIVLYIYGVLLMLSLITAVWFAFNVEANGKYGCSVQSTEYATIILGIYSIGYLIWDLTVLFMYILKFCQSRRRFVNTTSPDNHTIFKKINFILTKILILTLIYEIKGISSVFIIQFTSNTIINVVVIMTDEFVIALAIYLMGEQNNDEYIMFHDVICCNCNFGQNMPDISELERVASKTSSNSTGNQQESVKDSSNKSGEHKEQKNNKENSYGELTITVKRQFTNPYVDEESMSKDTSIRL